MESPLQTIERLQQQIRDLEAQLSAAPQAVQAGVSLAHRHEFTDGHRTLKQDVFSAIHDYAATKPEQDPDDPESWESWFEAAFDLLGTRIGQIFEEHAARTAAAPAHPAEGAQPEANQFDVNTSNGARGYVAWHFSNVIGRHDFKSYIENTLAADFSCALAKWLSTATHPTQQGLDAQDSWIDLKIAFDIPGDEVEALWGAVEAGGIKLPKGWSLAETTGSGCAGYVAIFRVDHLPTSGEAFAVSAVLAAQAKQGGE